MTLKMLKTTEVELIFDGEIILAVAKDRFDENLKNRKMLYSELRSRCSSTFRTNETFAKYLQMSRAQKTAVKDVGGFVGGEQARGHRGNDSVQSRSVITFDFDHIKTGLGDFIENLKVSLGCAFFAYTTHSHSSEAPRVRVVIPVPRALGLDEYQAVARCVAHESGLMNELDSSTFEPARLMFWPSTSKDGDFFFDHQDEPWLDPDEALAKYHDWRDASSWPTNAAEMAARPRVVGGKKLDDPREKKNIIGAFCRVYGIVEAAVKFIPEAYDFHDATRGTWLKGSTHGGVLLFDNLHVHSMHGTDPTSGRSCNAWDMVRIHLFSSLDIGTVFDDIKDAPSQVAMIELAMQDPAVMAEMASIRAAKAAAEMAEIEAAEDPENLALWYSTSKNGELKDLIPDKLAEHLRRHHPALQIGGAIFQYQGGVYRQLADDQVKIQIRQHLLPGRARVHNMNEVLSIYKTLAFADPDSVNNQPHLINLKNGLLDVRTGRFLDHSPEILSTFQIQANFDPEAQAPRFRQYLDEVLDEDAQLVIQELSGYIVSCFMEAKKAFVLTGIQNSGKSLFINTIEALVGIENCSNVALQDLGERFNAALLFGKALNSSGDLNRDALKNSGFLKKLTGEDPINAERKGEQGFSFVNKAKLLFACNELPKIYNDRTAIDRLCVVKFDRSVPIEKRKNLLPVFKGELDGILAWALEGLRRLMESNFKFSDCAGSNALMKEYAKLCDPLELFIEEICELGPDFESPVQNLYRTYCDWADLNGYHKLYVLQNFSIKLQALRPELTKKRVKRSYGYVNIMKGLRTISDDDAENDFTVHSPVDHRSDDD